MTKALSELRNNISHIDHQILLLLAERMNYSKEVAQYKRIHNLQIYDKVREEEIIEKYSSMVDFDVSNIYRAIMDESKKIQKALLDENIFHEERG